MKSCKPLLSNEPFPLKASSSNKISAKPIYRKNIQNEVQAQKKILIQGIKYSSKISAVGKTTSMTLRFLSKSKAPKLTYAFEFDSYLCEKSCLPDLCKALSNNTIKGLRYLNLVFRRLDRFNESDLVIPFVRKQLRLQKLRLELPKTEKIDGRGIKNLARMLGRCVTIKSYEELIVDLENVPYSALLEFQRNCQRILGLEELKLVFRKTGKLNNVQATGIDPVHIHPRSNKNLKKLSISSGVSSGWFSLNTEDGNEKNNIVFFKDMTVPINLEHVTFKFSGLPSTIELYGMLTKVFPLLTKLRYLSLEFLNCKLGDFEVIELAQILSKASQIKQLTLKIIQYPSISKDCIFYLAKTLGNMQNLAKFDIYLRRLSLDDEELNELMECLSNMRELRCILFQKQSLHFSKNPEINNKIVE